MSSSYPKCCARCDPHGECKLYQRVKDIDGSSDNYHRDNDVFHDEPPRFWCVLMNDSHVLAYVRLDSLKAHRFTFIGFEVVLYGFKV